MAVPHLRIVDSNGRKIAASSYMSSGNYEGSGSGRRMSTWGTSNAGPNTALYGSMSTLRSRSRELIRNDPQVDGGLDTLVSEIIGMGISPRWQIDDIEIKRELQALWSDWAHESDADNLLNF